MNWATKYSMIEILWRIREPSQAMILAGAKKVRGGTAYDCAAATWRAMIDELLRQPEAQPSEQEMAERQSS